METSHVFEFLMNHRLTAPFIAETSLVLRGQTNYNLQKKIQKNLPCFG